MAERVKVRLVQRPYEEIEVPPDEAAVLRHQGLLYDGDAISAPAPEATPVKVKSENKQQGA